MSDQEKIDALNKAEGQYDAVIATVLAHRHDSRYYTHVEADAQFFGPSHQGIGSGMNAGKLDGHTASDIISASIASGLILMYAGTEYTPPSGWSHYSAMDGNFLVGAGSAFPVNTKGGSSTLQLNNIVTSINAHAITEEELPHHAHNYTEQFNLGDMFRKNDSNAVACRQIGTVHINTDYASDVHGNFAGGLGHTHEASANITAGPHIPPSMILQFIKKV